MTSTEANYRVVAALLRSDRPLTLAEVVEETGARRAAVMAALDSLDEAGDIRVGDLVTGEPGPQYAWRELAADDSSRRVPPGLNSELVKRFNSFVVNDYKPPKDKKHLVLFQCSVRRPFSTSPSQASMRRAVAMATGYDPAPRNDFAKCPVHVVVLASLVGPVPYDLEDLYPATVSFGGVGHFSNSDYAIVRPILAERMAAYIKANKRRYTNYATFTSGRYGEVMADAAELAGVDMAIFPDPQGPRVIRMGDSHPRQYWQKYWIQLCLEIANWLGPAGKRVAMKRLGDHDVEFA
ncbi:hypothetical protein LCGC14_0238550 [marine sediment metagenome]|uniref:DUF5591 domain-containing protein n=1 Tax=marine sediment metagenome TaxID=412755 RepID=A0A0F9UCH5_9ZZZZ|nr:hypothetical protein [Phycisphaerae bacterium]HDZ42692.1 hypothetical protein [Phycisphaerae bacterium]